MNELKEYLPPFLTGEELFESMLVLPDYDNTIRQKDAALRLIALSDIYDIYYPSNTSMEIYSRLYIALLKSLNKKRTKEAKRQRYENHKRIKAQISNGIIGGSDSFSIIGNSGVGKSSAIYRSIHLISENSMIELQNPFVKIVPILVVQCPFDASAKGLLLEILRVLDENIGSSYYPAARPNRCTVDALIGSVSQVALNHIGLLVIDEIQNVVNNKYGRNLIGMLTQLINSSGISICIVGTPESKSFFEQEMHLARRSLGISYDNLEYDSYFYNFCKTLLSYLYTKENITHIDTLIEWLYAHSSGVTSVVVSLIHDAQEIAILSGKERLNIDTLSEAYHKRLSLIHPFIKSNKTPKKISKTKKLPALDSNTKVVDSTDYLSIYELSKRAKNENIDFIGVLKGMIHITEVQI